jgi:hypothetical protein
MKRITKILIGVTVGAGIALLISTAVERYFVGMFTTSSRFTDIWPILLLWLISLVVVVIGVFALIGLGIYTHAHQKT